MEPTGSRSSEPHHISDLKLNQPRRDKPGKGEYERKKEKQVKFYFSIKNNEKRMKKKINS